jgi:hypothetical protein
MPAKICGHSRNHVHGIDTLTSPCAILAEWDLDADLVEKKRLLFTHMLTYAAHVPLDGGYRERQGFFDLPRTRTWIMAVMLHEDDYSQGMPSHSHEAARHHVLSLTALR